MSMWEGTIREVDAGTFELDQYFCLWCGSDHGCKKFSTYEEAEGWIETEGFQKRVCEECQLSVGP